LQCRLIWELQRKKNWLYRRTRTTRICPSISRKNSSRSKKFTVIRIWTRKTA